MTPKLATAHGATAESAAPCVDLPTIGRRGLLLGGGAALAGLVATQAKLSMPSLLPLGSTLASVPLTAAAFVPYVGSTFTLTTTAGAVDLDLVEVLTVRSHPSEPPLLSGEAFSLLFEGPLHSVAEQGHHQLRHDTLAVPSLFVSPHGRSTTVQEYQAIIDHRVFDIAQKEN